MTHNRPEIPVSPHPLSKLTEGAQRRVLTAGALREHGVPTAEADERCRPGGPWQLLLPGVYLLRSGPPSGGERLYAALLYAGGRSGEPAESVPVQRDGRAEPPGAAAAAAGTPTAGAAAMITGCAALALHGFAAVPPLRALDRVDVLVCRARRLRSAHWVRVVHTRRPPCPEEVGGVPAAPVPRALADAVAACTDAVTVRRLLTESVRAGHCEPAAVVRELRAARLLGRPQLGDAVDLLLAEGRALAEARLYEMVFRHWLPEPCWNVELRLPGGPSLGGVDAYWPGEAVALELDAWDEDGERAPAGERERDRRREVLEGLGVTVVRLAPERLRDALEQQAAIVRTALMTAAEREPAEHVVVLPR